MAPHLCPPSVPPHSQGTIGLIFLIHFSFPVLGGRGLWVGSFSDCPHSVFSPTHKHLQVYLLIFPSCDPKDSTLYPLSCIFNSHLLPSFPHGVFPSGFWEGREWDRPWPMFLKRGVCSVMLSYLSSCSPFPPQPPSPAPPQLASLPVCTRPLLQTQAAAPQPSVRTASVHCMVQSLNMLSISSEGPLAFHWGHS